MWFLKKIAFSALVFLLLTSCYNSPKITPGVVLTDDQPHQATITITPVLANLLKVTPSPTKPEISIEKPSLWIDPLLPAVLRAGVMRKGDVEEVGTVDKADISISLLTPGDEALAYVDWVYVIATRFPMVKDGITMGKLKLLWNGDRTENLLLLDQETLAIFSLLWGAPSKSSVQVLPKKDLLQAVWDQPNAFALIPFEEIEPRYKILTIDGMSPLDKSMDVRLYPLAIKAGIHSRSGSESSLLQVGLPFSNREPEKIISLAMTGVTALVRGTARMMNERGVLFPAQDVGKILNSADLTHISNEVSFNQDCIPARAASPESVFCSSPEYMQLLDTIGTDIVELTGNHNLDKGSDAYIYTMNQYQERGWSVFGGGNNLDSAKKALIIERGNTRLAFIGCNWAGPEMAWATKNKPGAAPCDIDWMVKEVKRLRVDGILPIVTFQSFETEDYMPAPMQHPSDYSRVAKAGAVIVSGSQAHFPQGFKFEDASFIHYGLGNLFFDQMQPPATRRSFIDRHIFYGDKYLGVELITTKIEDSARPRLMSQEERSTFLTRVFSESGWTEKQP
jgi:hypothetical protein